MKELTYVVFIVTSRARVAIERYAMMKFKTTYLDKLHGLNKVSGNQNLRRHSYGYNIYKNNHYTIQGRLQNSHITLTPEMIPLTILYLSRIK